MARGKPKILHTLTWVAPGGGVDEQVKLTAKLLCEKYEFHLLTGREINSTEIFSSDSLKVHICPWMTSTPTLFQDILAFFWIRRFLLSNKFDLIHTHETKSSFLCRLAYSRSRVKSLIYGIEGVVFNDPRNRLVNAMYIVLERFTVFRANILVAVSHSVRSEYLSKKIGANMNWRIIYSGIDTERFKTQQRIKINKKELGIGSKEIVLINIGRFSKSKNQRDTVLAFAKLLEESPKKRFKLLMIGEGPEKEQCATLAKELQIEDSIKFLGFRGNIEDFLAISDVNIITSLREGLPRTVTEAALMQVPTVGYIVEGLEEAIVQGVTGQIVYDRNPQALAIAIRKCLEDEYSLLEWGKKARLHALRHWSSNRMAHELQQLYDSLLENK